VKSAERLLQALSVATLFFVSSAAMAFSECAVKIMYVNAPTSATDSAQNAMAVRLQSPSPSQ